MRWKSLGDGDLHPANWIWLWLPALALLLFLAPFFAMEWLDRQKRKLMGPSKHWRPWFAWYPVRAFTAEFTKTVWLEWVERRKEYDFTDYRASDATR